MSFTYLQKYKVCPPLAVQKRMTTRTNVGVMMSGAGTTADVWAATEQFLKVGACAVW